MSEALLLLNLDSEELAEKLNEANQLKAGQRDSKNLLKEQAHSEALFHGLEYCDQRVPKIKYDTPKLAEPKVLFTGRTPMDSNGDTPRKQHNMERVGVGNAKLNLISDYLRGYPKAFITRDKKIRELGESEFLATTIGSTEFKCKQLD